MRGNALECMGRGRLGRRNFLALLMNVAAPRYRDARMLRCWATRPAEEGRSRPFA